MRGSYYLLPALITVVFSFLIVRAAAIALMMTGLDQRKARFQALSAFSGTGFTTKEAESVINHPVRRKIISVLIIAGNAGIVALIVATTSSFVESEGFGKPLNFVLLLVGGYLVYRILSRNKIMNRWEKFVQSKLVKSPVFDEMSTEDLLHLLDGYGLVRATIKESHPKVGLSIAECGFKEEGILILGIERAKLWIPNPQGTESILTGDHLVVYGPLSALREAFGSIHSHKKSKVFK
ncbi:MAG: TrkA C-terminal domain-containing protein [Chitinispirillaceae bacterium]